VSTWRVPYREYRTQLTSRPPVSCDDQGSASRCAKIYPISWGPIFVWTIPLIAVFPAIGEHDPSFDLINRLLATAAKQVLPRAIHRELRMVSPKVWPFHLNHKCRSQSHFPFYSLTMTWSRVCSTWKVTCASNGETALRLTDTQSFDIIFMDQYVSDHHHIRNCSIFLPYPPTNLTSMLRFERWHP